MKKILTIWLILIIVSNIKNVYATETNHINNEEILNEQQQELRNFSVYR